MERLQGVHLMAEVDGIRREVEILQQLLDDMTQQHDMV